jgi:hypothetical protein
MKILLDYPAWIYAVCILVGMVFSFLLYRNDKFYSSLSKQLKYTLLSLRFLLGFLLTFLLFNPQIFSKRKIIDKPIISFVIDNSQSVVSSSDSSLILKDLLLKVDALKQKLGDKFVVHSYVFGEQLKSTDTINFSDKLTDFSEAFTSLSDRYYNQNLSSVVVVSDGISNHGNNALYPQYFSSTKLYTIAVGDTSVRKDIAITNVQNNNIAFLGNKFPLNVSIKAHYFKGKPLTLSVFKGNQEIFTTIINCNNNSFFHDELIMLEAKQIGVVKYTLKIKQEQGEYSYANNSYDIFIDVINSKQSILLLANAPHPDLAAIRNSLSKNINYAVDVAYAYNFKESTKPYDVVVLHNLPNKSANTHIEKLLNSKVSKWLITGSDANYNLLNNHGISLTNVNGFTEAGMHVNNSFSLFDISNMNISHELPPLKTPFAANYGVSVQHVLLNQKIGTNKTNLPLMGFFQQRDIKYCYTLGEGMWRWRLVEYQRTNNTLFFDALIQKTIQYLYVKEDKSLFKVLLNKNSFQENEQVVLRAELYNKTYELVNSADVSLELSNSKGEKFNYEFSKTNAAYTLNLGTLPSDTYSYIAETNFNEEKFQKSGAFMVSALQKELVNTQANHQLLMALSAKYDGKMFYHNQLNELQSVLMDDNNFPAIIRYEESTEPIVNLFWILVLLISIAALEWFIRKRNGAY